MTKDEVIAAINECAATLGHVPSFPELSKTMNVMKWDIRRCFGTYGRALKACDMRRQGSGYKLDQRAMFESWAGVVRQLQRVPTQSEYHEHSRHGSRTLVRWCGGWRNIPRQLREYILQEGLEGEWKDVVELVARHLEAANQASRPFGPTSNLPSRPRIMLDQPIYGTPMLSSPLSCAPVNEAGVLFLFGAAARQQGFVVTRLQQEFPDCEALRQVEPDRWQKVIIEFEFESRNFLLHGHRVEDCDLIVCWRHNWAECPLEVLELKNIVWN